MGNYTSPMITLNLGNLYSWLCMLQSTIQRVKGHFKSLTISSTQTL